jgi:uncharacterized Zn-finger protein
LNIIFYRTTRKEDGTKKFNTCIKPNPSVLKYKFQCKICPNTSFYFKGGLVKHIDKFHKKQQKQIYQCPYHGCNRSFGKPSYLECHVRSHNGEKPYVCNWAGCSKKFGRKDKLVRHFRSHNGEKPFCCMYCTKKFTRSDHLRKHITGVHRNMPMPILKRFSKFNKDKLTTTSFVDNNQQ